MEFSENIEEKRKTKLKQKSKIKTNKKLLIGKNKSISTNFLFHSIFLPKESTGKILGNCDVMVIDKSTCVIVRWDWNPHEERPRQLPL